MPFVHRLKQLYRGYIVRDAKNIEYRDLECFLLDCRLKAVQHYIEELNIKQEAERITPMLKEALNEI